jgi:CRP-like cAMP-binding protein
MIARLVPSHIFGRVSLIDREPRPATCTAHRDTLLVEMARENCVRLFRSQSQTALKFPPSVMASFRHCVPRTGGRFA